MNKKTITLDENLQLSLSTILDLALKTAGLEIMPLVVELICALEESEEDEEWLRKLEFDL